MKTVYADSQVRIVVCKVSIRSEVEEITIEAAMTQARPLLIFLTR